MRRGEAGGGRDLKEMYVLEIQGMPETLTELVLSKRQEHKTKSNSMEQDTPGGEDGGQMANARTLKLQLRYRLN